MGAGWVQQGGAEPVNQHTPYGKANSLVAIDQLKRTCANVGWVSVVVSWFGTGMDAADCRLVPGVEYK